MSNGEVGPPPKHLTKQQREAWVELLAESFPGVLCRADRLLVEVAAKLRAEQRYSWESFTASKFKMLEAALGRLGMTPADRSRVQQPEEFRNPKRSIFAALKRRAR